MEITSKNFKDEVVNEKGLVMVDFWAPWCSPCRMLAPIIDELTEEYKGKIKICKCNVDEAKEIAITYGIMSVPTIKFFKDGEVISEIMGLVNKDVLKKRIEALISGA